MEFFVLCETIRFRYRMGILWVSTKHCHVAARYKFKHAGAPKFDFPLHCWWCEKEQNIKSEMVQVGIALCVAGVVAESSDCISQ